MWAKGQSGNPGGRPKEDDELKRLARSYTKDAIDRLFFWLYSDNPKASVSAAQTLLDRGYGRSAQSVEVSGSVGTYQATEIPVEPRDADPLAIPARPSTGSDTESVH